MQNFSFTCMTDLTICEGKAHAIHDFGNFLRQAICAQRTQGPVREAGRMLGKGSYSGKEFIAAL